MEGTVNRQDAGSRTALLWTLVIVVILPSLDQGIMSTAMPRIAVKLDGLGLYPWVTTAYLVASTLMMPIFGKACDTWDQRSVLITGICLFSFGSALCGLSGAGWLVSGNPMLQLVAARTVQGIGGAGLIAGALAAFAHLFSPRDQARLGGVFTAAYGLASLLGPIVGGVLSDMGAVHLLGVSVAGWRWVFYLNIPLSVFAFFMALARMPRNKSRRSGELDLLGAATLLMGFLPLLFALSGVGDVPRFGSSLRIILFVLAGMGLIAFVYVERVASNPIVSLSYFRNPIFVTANLADSMLFMALVGIVSFLPLLMQLGLGITATSSGVMMLSLTIGIVSSSTICGYIVSKTGRYKKVLIFGVLTFCTAALCIAEITRLTSPLSIVGRIGLLGIGLGPIQSLFNLAIRNSVDVGDLGSISSISQFWRQIGLTLGIAFFGNLLTQNLREGVQLSHAHTHSIIDLQRAATPLHVLSGQMSTINSVTAEIVTTAISRIMLDGFGICLLGLVCTLLVPEVPLRGRPGMEMPTKATANH